MLKAVIEPQALTLFPTPRLLVDAEPTLLALSRNDESEVDAQARVGRTAMRLEVRARAQQRQRII